VLFLMSRSAGLFQNKDPILQTRYRPNFTAAKTPGGFAGGFYGRKYAKRQGAQGRS
jgi:hypothetical protein